MSILLLQWSLEREVISRDAPFLAGPTGVPGERLLEAARRMWEEGLVRFKSEDPLETGLTDAGKEWLEIRVGRAARSPESVRVTTLGQTLGGSSSSTRATS